MDTGNAAWILTSASLVFLMTPGVAFFYGGMVRAKAVLNMMIMEAAALSVTMVVWVFWGWSIAYAGKSIGGIFGDPASGFLLKDSMIAKDGVFTATGLNDNKYPVSIDVAFQAAFAMITVALICGAIAERVKYSTWMIFVALWITFDYAPLAHMVWNGGLLSSDGAISQAIGAAAHDFAGGTVVHINAAVAALIIVLIIGKRKGFGMQPFRPHNVPFVMLGAFLLWFGWFGFNAGSAFAANGTAGYAWVSTSAATAAAMLSWGPTEKIRTGHYTAMGAASGIVAGLVAITPAADVVSPLWAIVLGAIAGVLTCLACGLKFKLGYDDSLDVVGVHGVGGFTGTVLIGFFGEGTGL
ncbi:ammonium transporter, partial [Bifidobacterium angulatum]|uniref:ammonium transporter n=1 Tax=Bifidobacterium angulatum TaxID=1683 RepID=UPI003AB67E3C